ncbi:MAG: tRNA 2-thiocytidine biosynthesis protein TtcA [Spirochaetaceae bacterium]|nr:tRNA 2-thiocytidine biosynthesis protein TtcA [Spirochaetaceae bacterium]
MPQPKLFRIIDKAVYEYNMIETGDRILIGASGGKDSTALVEYFANRKKQNRERFDFAVLHISSDHIPPFDKQLEKRFAEWGVNLKFVSAEVLGRLKPGHKMNCWWCSTQRRTELNNYAISNDYNKIALGHHMDDILETLIMNALQKGELSTMPPRLQYDKYPVTIIRPLCFADENTIIEHSKNHNYVSYTCSCEYQDNSARKEARKRLELLTNGNVSEKIKLFEAIKNVKTDYLP